VKILITGGTGLLGKALVETNNSVRDITAVYIGNYAMQDGSSAKYIKADICDKDAMGDIFASTIPDVVIHTAGAANVDFCEKNQASGRRANVYGTEVITSLCKIYGSKMVFISTNAVFDGKNAPYSEAAAPCPLNIYGKMKLEAEKIVSSSGLKYQIIRPILMYGWNDERERANPVTWLINKLKNKETVNMVDDVYENPLFSNHCAEIIWALIDKNKEGYYHVAGTDVVNRYQFAHIVAEIFGLDKNLVKAVPSSFFKDIAPRPANTSYSTAKVEKDLNIKLPGLRKSLELMKNMKGAGCPK